MGLSAFHSGLSNIAFRSIRQNEVSFNSSGLTKRFDFVAFLFLLEQLKLVQFMISIIEVRSIIRVHLMFYGAVHKLRILFREGRGSMPYKFLKKMYGRLFTRGDGGSKTS